MKVLVVYYSRTGNTKQVAQTIARELDADLLRIKETKRYRGWFGFLKAGYQAVCGKTVVIETTEANSAEYDLIVLGSPVWAASIPPPLLTYIQQHKHSFNDVAFFCTESDSGGDRVFNSMERLIGEAPVATLEIKVKEIEEGSSRNRASAFSVGLITEASKHRLAEEQQSKDDSNQFATH